MWSPFIKRDGTSLSFWNEGAIDELKTRLSNDMIAILRNGWLEGLHLKQSMRIWMMVSNPITTSNVYPEPEVLEYIEHQAQLFDQMRPELLKHYQDQYVWFEDGKVLDTDQDQAALAIRVYGQAGLRPLLIKKVRFEDPQPLVRTPFLP